MTDHDDIRSGLIDAASSIEVGDLDSARSGVYHAVRRRRLRTRVGAGVGVAALLVAGVVAAVALDDSDRSDTLVSAEPTIVEGPVTTDAPEATEAPAELPATQVEVLAGTGVVGAALGHDGAPEYAEWAVPWQDGFLVGSTVQPPQPLPTRLPDEVRALFPQEVLDLFVDGLPPTLAEATTMLEEAGLLDEVTSVMEEHPEVSEAIYGLPSTEPVTVEARFTTDGLTWEPVEMTMPPGASYFTSVTAVGGRLVAAYDGVDRSDPTAPGVGDGPAVIVATTTDLTTWTTQEITPPAPPVVFPDSVFRTAGVQGLAANQDGWVITLFESTDVDVLSLVPADVRERVEAETDDGSGFGTSYDSTGVTLEWGMDDTGVPTESIRYSWDELGLAPEVVEYLSNDEYRPQLWAARWDGAPARSDAPDGSGQVLATSAGFLMWTDQVQYSADGLTWTARPLPEGSGYVEGGFGFDGGVIVVSSGSDGSSVVHRLDDTGGSPERLVVSGLPDSFHASYGTSWAPGSAIVLDAGDQGQPTEPLVIEADGYRLTIDSQTGAVELTDPATGVVVVSAAAGEAGTPGSPFAVGDDGLTVTDPDTGKVLFAISTDELNAATTEHYGGTDEFEYAPDLWLLATTSGEDFVVADLDDSTGYGVGGVVTNGDAALVQSGEHWILYDLS